MFVSFRLGRSVSGSSGRIRVEEALTGRIIKLAKGLGWFGAYVQCRVIVQSVATEASVLERRLSGGGPVGALSGAIIL